MEQGRGGTAKLYKKMYGGIFLYAAALAVAAVIFDEPSNILPGLRKIVSMQDILITDYIQIAGTGAAFLNSSLVTLASLVLLILSKDPPNGFTITKIGLMSGFALFGKNMFNIWPIVLGTWLYSRIQKENFSKYISVALLATALSPLISYMSFGSRFASLPLGLATGVLIGMVLPPVSAYTYKLQNGMNLYNMGFACGLLAMMLVPILTAIEDAPSSVLYWSEGNNLRFGIALTVLCVLFILAGLFLSSRPAWAVWAGYRRLLHSSGRAPSDYLRMLGGGPVLVNMGINGLISMGYILLVGGDLNGPTIGGILTVIGFSAYGKHARNIIPVMFGVLLGGIFMHYEVASPSLQLAALFGTTLAPFSGIFGWPAGILAGFLHSAVVLQAGSPLAGVNLYNNGFSGGLIAIVLFPTLTAIVRHRKPELAPRDEFEVFLGVAPSPMEQDMTPEERDPQGEPFPVLRKRWKEWSRKNGGISEKNKKK